jgi:diaminobutyrate-2-oxoglutarate transaminase
MTTTLAPKHGVRTEIPGPKSKRLLARQEARESSARTYPRRLPIAIARASGSYIEDLDGNVFIDFLMGVGALALGHNHPEVLEAVERQLHEFCNGLDFPTEIRDEFMSVQLSLLPEAMRDTTKIQFCGPTGANAVDAAIKLCKIATGRSDVVAFRGAFHGSSHTGLALTGLVSQKEPVPNAMPGVHFFPFPYAYRWPAELHPETCAEQCLYAFENGLKDPLGGIPRPAAVILEVVQAEGGVIDASPEFVRGVRRVTAELDIPLIVDEVQSGCGRTGTWYAFEHYDIVPDVVVASKGLGGIGMPIAVVLYHEKLDLWSAGAHTGTFRGNQLAFAAAVASAKIIQRDGILRQVQELGEYLTEELRGLQARHDVVGDVRGRGLLLGLELVDPETGAENGTHARMVQRKALERGLIIELGGRHNCVVRLLPPLNVSRETVDDALGILEAAIVDAADAAA